MVTHPSINWAHDCLTSVFKHKTFTPCYVSLHIGTIGSVCHKLTEQDVEELRTDIHGLLRRVQAPKPNLNKAEIKGLAELKRDKDRIILTVDRSVTMVVLDRESYREKAENLHAKPAYRTIDRDPTIKLKAKLILLLRRIKRETNMNEGMYKTMYPTGCTPPKFYGLPKIHKTGTPSGPLSLARVKSHMGWPWSLLGYLNHL